MLDCSVLFLVQLYNRRARALKRDSEKGAWSMITPDYMSEEESEVHQGSKRFMVHSPHFRSEGTFKGNASSIMHILH